MAKVADIFGRFEVLLFAIFFYILGMVRRRLITAMLLICHLGTVIEAISTNISTFAGGNILQQLGLTTCILILEIIISDTTSMRSRVFLLYT